jgi:ligand-binding sensor domain-containing protein
VDESPKVLTEEKDVIGYAGWGSNDPNRHARTLGFQWLPGALVTEYVSTDDGKGLTYIATHSGLLVARQSTSAAQLGFRLLPTPAAAGGSNAHGLLLEADAVWYGCGVGLCRIGKEGVDVYGEASGLSRGSWTCIHRDGNGDLWVSGKRRFAVMRRGSQRFDSSIPSFPATAGSRQLAVDADGRLTSLRHCVGQP